MSSNNTTVVMHVGVLSPTSRVESSTQHVIHCPVTKGGAHIQEMPGICNALAEQRGAQVIRFHL